MNKTEFLRAIANETGATLKDTTAFYNAFVETVRNAMAKNDKVALVGFGTFVAKHKNASVRPNPQKPGETINVAACEVPALKFGKSFKDSIN